MSTDGSPSEMDEMTQCPETSKLWVGENLVAEYQCSGHEGHPYDPDDGSHHEVRDDAGNTVVAWQGTLHKSLTDEGELLVAFVTGAEFHAQFGQADGQQRTP